MRTKISLFIVFFALCFQMINVSNVFGEEKTGPAGLTEYRQIRRAVDFIDDVYTSKFVTFQDMRLSPAVKCEQWLEFPVETSVLTSDDQIVPDLKKLSDYNQDGNAIECYAVNISVSAEKNVVTGKPILVLTLMSRLYSGKFEPARIKAENLKVQRALSGLLQTTTFTPQIRRRVDKEEVALRGRDWITNVRIDGDGRMMLTGYALDIKSITRLGEKLLNTGAFSDIYLHNMTKNVYEKKPVWRFDMSGKTR